MFCLSCLFSGLHENFPEFHDNPDGPHLVPVRNALKPVCFNISSLVSILCGGHISKGEPFYRLMEDPLGEPMDDVTLDGFIKARHVFQIYIH